MPQEIKDHHEKQSQTLKQALTMDPIMRHPDFTKKFILLCGASNVAIGGVLAQESKDDKTLLHPIIFFGSKALSMAERNISTYDEKEFLAIVYFVQFYRQYLLENHFIICTDQKSWQYLVKFNDDDAATKIVRWQAPLLGYDFDIIYKAVKERTCRYHVSTNPWVRKSTTGEGHLGLLIFAAECSPQGARRRVGS